MLANGYRVGVLCALDTLPHAMSASSTRLMVNVAGLIAREIEGLAGAEYDLPLQPKVRLLQSCFHLASPVQPRVWLLQFCFILHLTCSSIDL